MCRAILAALLVPIATCLWLCLHALARQPPVALDSRALIECAPDFGGGWELWPEFKARYAGTLQGSKPNPSEILNRWMGRVSDPARHPSPDNKILDAGFVEIRVCASPAEAVRFASGFSISAVPHKPGSYSGKRIGDWSVYSRSGTSLCFTRGSIAYAVLMNGKSPLDWPALVEQIAVALVERADAAMALAASPDATVQVGTSSLACRQPNGVTLVHVSEYATASGGSCQLDVVGGTAQTTRNGHTLKVNIGRKEGWLDGKAVTLPFPALRHGVNQVYCPLETLRKLGN